MAVLRMLLRLLTQEQTKKLSKEEIRRWLYLNHMKEELIRLMLY